MNPGADDLVIRVKLEQGEGVDAGVLLDTFNALEGATWDVSFAEIDDFHKHVRRSSSPDRNRMLVAADAAKERLRAHRGKGLRIISATDGCIVLTTSLVALAAYVLKNTLGDSFAEGWKQSRARPELTEWFRRQFDTALDRVTSAATRKLERKGYRLEVSRHDDKVVELKVISRREDEIPTYGVIKADEK